MSGTLAGFGGNPGPFGAFLAGRQASQQEERNRLFNIGLQQQQEDATALRALRPGLAAGDPNAVTQLASIDPARGAQFQTFQNSRADQQFQQGSRATDVMARYAAALEAVPEGSPERAERERVIRERVATMGLALPEGPISNSQIAAWRAGGMTLPQQFEQQRNAITVGPGGSGGPTAGGTGSRTAPAGGGNWLDTLMAQESGGNPNARNPRSSATGPFQFIDSTWRAYVAANPDRFAGMTPEQAMARRTDPNEARNAALWYSSQNGQALSSAGLPAGAPELALAHFAGSGGARALLQADPNASAESVLGSRVIAANPALAGRTAGQIVDVYRRRYGGTQVAGPGAPTDTGGAAPPAAPTEDLSGAPPAAPAGSLPAAAPSTGLPGGAQPLMRNGLPIVQGDRQAVQYPDGRRAWVPLPAREPSVPPTYDTVQLADGVYRVNNRDPNDRVRVGDRPPPANQAQGRVLSDTTRRNLNETGTTISGLSRLLDSFKDEYTATIGTGGVQNMIGRNFGMGLEDQGQWWQDYATFANTVRHQLFGAALTETEKREFDRAMISTSMSPSTIRRNLGRQRDIAASGARRMAASLATDRYNPEAIGQALGMEPSDFQGAAARPSAPAPTGAAPPTSPAAATARPRARNNQTGEELEFNGQQWVPVQ